MSGSPKRSGEAPSRATGVGSAGGDCSIAWRSSRRGRKAMCRMIPVRMALSDIATTTIKAPVTRLK